MTAGETVTHLVLYDALRQVLPREEYDRDDVSDLATRALRRRLTADTVLAAATLGGTVAVMALLRKEPTP